MADYISREALIERLGRNLAACNPGTFSEACYKDTIETVRNFPAADVAPVRHARLVDDGGFFFRCSECDGLFPFGGNFCPNCGARMDGGAENAV